jgi:DNA-binding YbaB/EbfC family protein
MSSPFEQAGLGGIFAEVQRLQEQLAAAEATSSATEVEGSSGGGAVRIKVSGQFSFNRVTIDSAVLADGDVSILEDLVLAALRDASAKLLTARKEAMGQAVGGALSAMLGAEGGMFGTAASGTDDGPVIELGFPDLGER